MEAATAITVFNGRVDKATRREVFVPTRISFASYLEARGSSRSKGVTTEAISFKLRIPKASTIQDNRTYVNEDAYKALADDESPNFWTLRKGDYILTAQKDDLQETIRPPGVDALAKEIHADLMLVVEYADNTVRGSEAVKHWRIGGA